MTRLPDGLWYVRSGTLFLTADGLLTKHRAQAHETTYSEAYGEKEALRHRGQPACLVRAKRAADPAFVAWFERYQDPPEAVAVEPSTPKPRPAPSARAKEPV
jgi:hypothetical protein